MSFIYVRLSEFHFPTILITNIDRVPLLIVEIVEMYITTINIGSNFTCPSNLLIGPRDVKENLKKSSLKILLVSSMDRLLFVSRVSITVGEG